jgi:raffinose/stachyose/melibiose transport system substrate-binding protein
MSPAKVSRRSLLRFLGAGTAAALLAACQPKVVEVTKVVEREKEVTKIVEVEKPKEVTKVVEKQVEKVVTATPVPDKFKGTVTVAVLGTMSPRHDVARDRLSSAYRDMHPNVQIKWEGPPEGGDYTTWLGTQLAAEPVALDIVSGNYVKSYGKYVDFDKYRKSINPYSGRPWDEDLDWDFFEGRWGANQRYLLATRGVHIGWFYNKDLFAKAGVTPPKSWPEFVDVCTKLKKAGITPAALTWVIGLNQWQGAAYLDQFFRNERYEIGGAKPGDWCYNPETDGKWKYDPKEPMGNIRYTFNAARWFKAIKDGKLRFDKTDELPTMMGHWQEIWPHSAIEDLYVNTQPYVTFLQQKAAMLLDGLWSIPSLVNDMKALDEVRRQQLKISPDTKIAPFQWGTFNNPGMVDDLVDGPIRTSESATGEYISLIQKAQAQTDLALDFLYFWLSPKGYQIWQDGLYLRGYTPTGPLMMKDVKDPTEYAEMFKNVEFIGNSAVSPYWYIIMPGKYMGGPFTTAINMTKDMLERKMTPKEYAQKMQEHMLKEDTWADLLAEVGLQPGDLDHPERKPGT